MPACLHAWLLGTQFEAPSLWSWGYLLAWPIPLGVLLITTLALYVAYTLCIVAIASMIGFGGWACYDYLRGRQP